MSITPSLLNYASLLITIYYIFAMLGMEIFANVIKSEHSTNNTNDCSNDKLAGTEFARFDSLDTQKIK
jgi:hypothetical protein